MRFEVHRLLNPLKTVGAVGVAFGIITCDCDGRVHVILLIREQPLSCFFATLLHRWVRGHFLTSKGSKTLRKCRVI